MSVFSVFSFFSISLVPHNGQLCLLTWHTWEKGIQTEELLPSDWTMCMSVGHLHDYWLTWGLLIDMGQKVKSPSRSVHCLRHAWVVEREYFSVTWLWLASCWWRVLSYFDPGLGSGFYFGQAEVSDVIQRYQLCLVSWACMLVLLLYNPERSISHVAISRDWDVCQVEHQAPTQHGAAKS